MEREGERWEEREMDGWMDEQDRESRMNKWHPWGGGHGGLWGEEFAIRMAAECVVIPALKKHEKHRRTRFNKTSPRGVYFNEAVYFIGVQ